MNIQLEDILKLASQEQEKNINIDYGYMLFLNYIKEHKRYATYQYHLAYYKSIKRFFDIEQIQYVNQINNNMIDKFISYERSRKHKNTTINKKVGHIKYLLNFLYRRKLINKPDIEYEKLSNDEQRYDVINKKDLSAIIGILDQLTNHEKLVLLLLITTGIRRTELYNIKLSDLYLDKLYINLSYTKNHKQRNIYINKDIADLIKIVSKDNVLYLFENEKHTGHENVDNNTNLMKKIEKLTGVHVSAHMLRHTFATNLLDSGADIESIRLLLGHSDYAMIQRYVHIKNKKLAELSTSLYDIELTKGNA